MNVVRTFVLSSILAGTAVWAASPARAEITAMTAVKAYMVLEKLKNLPIGTGDLRCTQAMLSGNACRSFERCNDTQRLLRSISEGSERAKSSLGHNIRVSSLYLDCTAALSKKSKGDWAAWADALGQYETAVARAANEQVLQEFLQCASRNGDAERATVEKSAEYMQAKCR